MPMPGTCRHASREFPAFLADARERLCLSSDNMTYTAGDAVFQVFRRRLAVEQGLRFADLLPRVLRAIFVANLDTTAPPQRFGPRADPIREVQPVRRVLDLTSDHAIEAAARALQRHLRQKDPDRLLEAFPDGARQLWHVDVADPRALARRIA